MPEAKSVISPRMDAILVLSAKAWVIGLLTASVAVWRHRHIVANPLRSAIAAPIVTGVLFMAVDNMNRKTPVLIPSSDCWLFMIAVFAAALYYCTKISVKFKDAA